MNYNRYKQESLTEQGRDTPVPVGEGSERAGSPRPSSNDCPAPEVANQAQVQARDTGTREEQVFGKKPRVMRTPPSKRTQSTPGLRTGASDYITPLIISDDDEDVFRDAQRTLGKDTTATPKRKRTETPEKEKETNKELVELRGMIKKLVLSSKQMKSLIDANPNTKVQLKQEVTRIGRDIEVLAAKCKEWETYPGMTTGKEIMEKDKRTHQTKEIGCQADFVGMTASRCIGIQVDANAEIERETREKEEIARILNEGTTIGELKDILEKNWPEDVYKCVKMVKGSPTQSEHDSDIALVTDVNPNLDRGFWKGMIDRHPEILEITKQGMVSGQEEFVEKLTKTKTSRRDAGETRKFIFLLPLEIQEGITEADPLFEMMTRLRDLMRKHDRKKIAIALQDGIGKDYSRKIMEYVFKDAGIAVTYLTPEKGGKGLRPEQTRIEEEKVLVKKGILTYADLLKKIKSEVDLKSTGADIRNIKKTAAGDLLFVVKGGAQKVQALRQEIRTKVREAMVPEKESPGGTCIITGMDEISTEEEIVAEVEKALKVKREDIKIKSLRMGKFGNQTAILQLPKAYAKELTRLGKIKIGWLTCRVTERIDIARCYRCLEFGHRTQGCQNADRGTTCLRCGQDGHRVKDCENPPRCTTCNQNDHRADQMKCPQFKKLVEAKRRRLLSRK